MILDPSHSAEPTDDIEDILSYHYDEITLLMLRAALFEWGWRWPSHCPIHPLDPLALGDSGYITEASKFGVVV